MEGYRRKIVDSTLHCHAVDLLAAEEARERVDHGIDGEVDEKKVI